jgi:hypothetical protein
MSNSGDQPDKKDLTSILDLPQADPVVREGVDQEELNDLKPVEQIQDFESLEQIGMIDHPASPADEMPPPESSAPFPESAVLSAELTAPEAFTPEEPSWSTGSEELPSIPHPVPDPVLDELKTYSESRKAAPFEPEVRNEFSLTLSGGFDPFSRDKLLLFITENQVGMGSSDLDFQINAGRVLIPRISEFSGIKLIQELRDSGLVFHLKRSEEGEDAPTPPDPHRYHYDPRAVSAVEPEIPVISPGMFKPEEYRVLDSIVMVQFLRAEILEVEKSDLFQDLLERMTGALKQRARLKGAHAVTALEHRVTPLRLSSQYQIELSASLLKRREP